MDPQEPVCASSALPARGILNPAPIPTPAAGLLEVTNPVLCIRAKPLTRPWRSPQHPSSCLPSWPCLVAISLVSAVRVGGAWKTWFLQMPPDATATNGTLSALPSAYSFTARSQCSGSPGGRDRRVRGWKSLHSINSQYSHHQE